MYAGVSRAALTLSQGGVIAYPTEAVWGLGCDPADRVATQRLLNLKRRPMDKGLVLVGSAMEQIEPLLSPLTEEQRTRVQATWPGPVTWLLPDPQDLIPGWIKGQHSTVAIRISAHPIVGALCNSFGGLIVSTSANRAGTPPARTRLLVMKRFGRDLDFVVPGRLGQEAQPSRIIDLASNTTLRT